MAFHLHITDSSDVMVKQLFGGRRLDLPTKRELSHKNAVFQTGTISLTKPNEINTRRTTTMDACELPDGPSIC